MTQVLANTNFGPHHKEVVYLLNVATGLAPEELARLAYQHTLHCQEDTFFALERVRQAANQQNWSLVGRVLQNLMRVYIGPDRCPIGVNPEVFNDAYGAVYFAALAVMSQGIISPTDFDTLTKACRLANIKQMSDPILEPKQRKVLMTV